MPVREVLKKLYKQKFPFSFVYHSAYWMLRLGKHVFPPQKYRLLFEKLLIMGVLKENLILSRPATDEELSLVHAEKYLKKIHSGKLSSSEQAFLELPFSPEIRDFALLSVGGTIQAAESALEGHLSVHIGGGFHHAYPDHGEGFCLLNDVAVATQKLIVEGRVNKVMIVDGDVHQGNGTAAVFRGRQDVFTFSIHQMDIYPAHKEKSSLDIGLWSGDGDDKYLEALQSNFPRLYDEFKPELVFYLAGADPYCRDQLGGLRLTKKGLMDRDLLILEGAKERNIPLVVLLAGGYAFDVADTVSIHFNTIQAARKIYKQRILKDGHRKWIRWR
ncbi:MAG: histone deacetylase [Acidobacteriota bacterium]